MSPKEGYSQVLAFPGFLSGLRVYELGFVNLADLHNRASLVELSGYWGNVLDQAANPKR